MTAKTKADINQLAYLSLALLIILQSASFLVLKYFQYSLNQQLFFGLIGNNLMACLIALPILIALVYLFWKKVIGLEVCLVLAGLISNILDRIIYGGVVDYFSIFFIPKFNLADIFIVAGCILLAYKLIRTI